MSSISVKPAVAALSVDGTSAGYVTVASAADFYPGATAWLYTPGVYSSLNLATALGGGSHVDTVVEARTIGVAGDSVKIALAGRVADAGGVLVTELGTTVTVSFENSVSTVAAIEAAISTHSTLIQVKTAGTGASVATTAKDTLAATSLAGGKDIIQGKYMITDLVGNAIGLRSIGSVTVSEKSPAYPTYGRSDVSAYKVGDGAQICQEASVVPLLSSSTVVKKDLI